MSAVSKMWVFGVFSSLLVMMVLGLSLVWLRIGRVDLAYELKNKQTELDNKESLVAKLVVERNTYLTPERLRAVANQQGLGPVRPGQMRKMSETGEDLSLPQVAQAAPKAVEPKSKSKQVPKQLKDSHGKNKAAEAKNKDFGQEKGKSKQPKPEVVKIAPRTEPIVDN